MSDHEINSDQGAPQAVVEADTSDPLPQRIEDLGDADPAVALYGCGFSIRTIADATDRGVKAVRSVLLRAGVTLRPPGASPHVSGTAVAALPPGPAATMAAALLHREAQARAAARPWDLTAGPDAWQNVLTEAVAEVGSITVTEAATRKLGHPPTSLQARAALRAAHRLHADGRLKLVHRKPAVGGRKQWTISDTSTPIHPDQPASRRSSPSAMDLVDRLIHQLHHVQAASQMLDPELCSPDATDRLTTAIDAAQADLAALRTGLDPDLSRLAVDEHSW
jgi:hypothetical protein